MKRLLDYLEKNSFEYQPTTFGASYFENVPPIHFDGAYIFCGPGEIYTAAWKALERYCNRRGYELKPWCGHPGYTTFRVWKNADGEALEHYSRYMKKSVDAAEQMIHLRATGFYDSDTPKQFDERIRGVMEFWGEELLNSLREAV